MNRIISMAGFVLLLAVQVSYGQKNLDAIVAVVGDDIITRSELDSALNNVRRQIRQRGSTPPAAEILQRQVLERLIIEKLQLRAAEENGITVDDPALNSAVESVARNNNLNLDQLRRAVEQDGIPYARFREQIRRELMINRLRQRVVESNIQISEQEVTNLMGNAANPQQTLEYHIAQILISVPEGASADQIDSARARAEQTLEQLRGGADFNQLAVSVSDDRQALEGGDLGWRSRQQLPTLFANTVPNMQAGEVSSLIRSPSGFHIVKLLETRGNSADQATPGSEAQRNSAREQLLRRKSEEEWELWLRRIRDEAYVEIRL